jgi:hypothetical protein
MAPPRSLTLAQRTGPQCSRAETARVPTAVLRFLPGRVRALLQSAFKNKTGNTRSDSDSLCVVDRYADTDGAVDTLAAFRQYPQHKYITEATTGSNPADCSQSLIFQGQQRQRVGGNCAPPGQSAGGDLRRSGAGHSAGGPERTTSTGRSLIKSDPRASVSVMLWIHCLNAARVSTALSVSLTLTRSDTLSLSLSLPVSRSDF